MSRPRKQSNLEVLYRIADVETNEEKLSLVKSMLDNILNEDKVVKRKIRVKKKQKSEEVK